GYDLVAMNPPFSVEGDKLAYVTHILHALERLAPGGVLVAITPPSWQYRSDRRSRAFQEIVEACGGAWEALPAGAFAGSGTGVQTGILRIGPDGEVPGASLRAAPGVEMEPAAEAREEEPSLAELFAELEALDREARRQMRALK